MAESLSRAAGVEVQPVVSDDGVVLRLPDCDAVDRLPELLVVDPDDVTGIVTSQVGGTALFAGRFRECAARALLLPRRTPGRRAPLWQQRQRAAHLLEVARHHPRFPIIIETVREVTQDVYDLPGLVDLMRGLRSGGVRLVEVATEQPSPFAATLLFRYTGAFMYDGDAPLAERRAAMLSMDPELLAAALGTLDLRELLDPDIVEQVVAELQHTAPQRRAATPDDLAELPRLLGPIPLTDLACRTTVPDLDDALASLGGRVAVGPARRRAAPGGPLGPGAAARRAGHPRAARPQRAAHRGPRPPHPARGPLRPDPRPVHRTRRRGRVRSGTGDGGAGAGSRGRGPPPHHRPLHAGRPRAGVRGHRGPSPPARPQPGRGQARAAARVAERLRALPGRHPSADGPPPVEPGRGAPGAATPGRRGPAGQRLGDPGAPRTGRGILPRAPRRAAGRVRGGGPGARLGRPPGPARRARAGHGPGPARPPRGRPVGGVAGCRGRPGRR